jgi:hypothetical protein
LTQLPGQLAQTGISLLFQSQHIATVAFEGSANLGQLDGRQGQKFGFAFLAVGQSGTGVGLAMGAMAIGFAAFASEADEGAAKDWRDRDRVGIVHVVICKC